MIRDRDAAFGHDFSARIHGLGINEIRTAFHAPNMNAYAERVIGTLRRECFDHVIVWNEAHVSRLLREFVTWYNRDRTHLALGADSPEGRSVEPPELGKVIALPCLGGLHHRYSRRAA